MTWLSFQLDYYHWITTILFVLSSIFVVYYGIFSPWYRTPFGRALLTVDAGISVALLPAFAHFALNFDLYDNMGMTIVEFCALTLVGVAIAYRIFTLWEAKHSPKWLNIKKLRDASKKQENQSPGE